MKNRERRKKPSIFFSISLTHPEKPKDPTISLSADRQPREKRLKS